MRLPAPALACGCAACRVRLHKEFARIVTASFDPEEIVSLGDVSRIGFGRQTVGERILAYTKKEA